MVPYCSCCLCLYFGSSIMLVTYFVNFRYLNDHLFGKELFILFAASAFRKLSSIYVFSYFPFGFEGRMWDLIVSVPDHCLSFYFDNKRIQRCFYITLCVKTVFSVIHILPQKKIVYKSEYFTFANKHFLIHKWAKDKNSISHYGASFNQIATPSKF